MSLLRSIAGGLRSLFRNKQVSQDLDEELNGFLEMAAEEKMTRPAGSLALRIVSLLFLIRLIFLSSRGLFFSQWRSAVNRKLLVSNLAREANLIFNSLII
jgi:hypothetical protein